MQRCLAVAFIWSLPPHNECAATFSNLHSTLYLYSAWGCFGPEEHLATHFWHSFAVLAIGFIPAVNSSNYRQYLHGQESPSGSLFSDQSNTLLFCSLIELGKCSSSSAREWFHSESTLTNVAPNMAAITSNHATIVNDFELTNTNTKNKTQKCTKHRKQKKTETQQKQSKYQKQESTKNRDGTQGQSR